MAVPKSIHLAKGLWRGRSRLNLPFLPPDERVSESPSSLHIDTDSQETFATITYNWSYKGRREEGTIILTKNGKSNVVEFGWVDSWHQSEAVMHLKGEELGNVSVKARGGYRAGKEVWGWTIEFLPSGDSLTMKMDNVSPKGEATWAVEATYTRE